MEVGPVGGKGSIDSDTPLRRSPVLPSLSILSIIYERNSKFWSGIRNITIYRPSSDDCGVNVSDDCGVNVILWRAKCNSGHLVEVLLGHVTRTAAIKFKLRFPTLVGALAIIIS